MTERTKLKLKWALHNCVGHPMMGVLQLVGCDDLAVRVHDFTIPRRR